MDTFSRKNIVRAFWDKHSLDDRDMFSVFVEETKDDDDCVNFYGYIGVNYLNSLFCVEEFDVYSSENPLMRSSPLNYGAFKIDFPVQTGFLEQKKRSDKNDLDLPETQNNYYYFKFYFDEKEWNHLFNPALDGVQTKVVDFLCEKLKRTSEKLYKLSCKIDRKLIILTNQEALIKENLKLYDQITDLKLKIKSLKNRNEQISRTIRSALE
jgi:hypothetical protein